MCISQPVNGSSPFQDKEEVTHWKSMDFLTQCLPAQSGIRTDIQTFWYSASWIQTLSLTLFSLKLILIYLFYAYKCLTVFMLNTPFVCQVHTEIKGGH